MRGSRRVCVWGGEGREYKREIKSVKMELEMDCGTVQFPELWWFLLLHLSGCEQRRRRQPWESPYIINDIISTTLSTKQMHKSLRLQSIDTETFNHVLNNDYCSHNAIIIFSCWFGLMCCQGVIGVRGDVKQPWSAERWLTAMEGKKEKRAAASLCGVAAEKWLSKNAVDICCFVYQLAAAE